MHQVDDSKILFLLYNINFSRKGKEFKDSHSIPANTSKNYLLVFKAPIKNLYFKISYLYSSIMTKIVQYTM